MLVFAVLLPTVDPVSLALEVVPLLILFELSIWLASVMERRWDIADQKSPLGESSEGPLRRLGAAGRGRPDRERRRRDRGRPIAAVGTGERARRGRALPGGRDPPRASSTRTRISSTRSTPASATGSPSARGSRRTSSASARLERADMEAIARLGAAECLRSGITTVGDLAFSGASAPACAELGLRAIVYLEVFGTRRGRRDAPVRGEARVRRPALSERVRLGVSPHAPYTCSTRGLRGLHRLGLPVATHLNESQDELDWLLRGEGPVAAVRGDARRADGRSGIRSLAARRPPRRARGRRALRQGRRRGDRPARAHGVAVAHCPRSNALLGCGIAPLARAARGRPPGRRRHRRRLVGAVARLLRGAAHRDRSRAGARTSAPTRSRATEALELATLGGAGALGLDEEIGSLVPGKRADLTVVSLSGSPYLPWEDPAAAVVYGGAPERVTGYPGRRPDDDTREEDSNGTS